LKEATMTISDDNYSTVHLAPQQKRSREARERILAAAEELLRSGGVEGFSMAAVAITAGLPVGNIYRRFEGRDALLNVLKEIVVTRIKAAVSQSVRNGGHEDLGAFVLIFAKAIGDVFSRDEALHRALFDPRVASPAMLATGLSTKSANFRFFHEGVAQYTQELPAKLVLDAAKVAFSIILNSALQKVRGVDVILSEMEWPSVISEFGAAANLYLDSAISRVMVEQEGLS
jgi:AcrR family transcriptional regulator